MWEDKTPIVREIAKIRAWKAGKHGRHIDLEFRFEALEDGVTLARRGTSAYGGLNIRLAPIEDMKLVHHADPADATPRMAWQVASGTWAGPDKPLSMVVFEKTANPGYPADYAEYPDLPWFQPTFPRAGDPPRPEEKRAARPALPHLDPPRPAGRRGGAPRPVDRTTRTPHTTKQP